jgi:polyisoprenyl-teichoic acid--peptidoglycan teichoic acid transferase
MAINRSRRRRSVDGIVRDGDGGNQPPGSHYSPGDSASRVETTTGWRAPEQRADRFINKLSRRRFFSRKVVVVFIVVLLAGAGLVSARFFKASAKIFDRNRGQEAVGLQNNVDLAKLRGEGDGRINILLIGIGGANHEAGDLSDSIMLVSINPVGHDVVMLSIPRDMYVKIPGNGSTKINAAHAYGEEAEPGSGPELLKRTVSETLAVPVHYYARVDFDGFLEAVNTVGGVEIDVKEAIRDPSYPNGRGGVETFRLAAGNQFLDGPTALKFARSRYSTSDFDRSQRQQQLLVAIKNKALSLGTLTNPVKLNGLLESAGAHARTDLRIDEILKLAEIAKKVNDHATVRIALSSDPGNFLVGDMVDGVSVLVPKADDYGEIQEYLRGILIDGYLKSESAKIVINNGSDRAGKATEVAATLRSFGYNVVAVNDTPANNHSGIKVEDLTGDKPFTRRYLEKRFDVTATQRGVYSPGQAEFIITVGN